jgi:hypothetical protein
VPGRAHELALAGKRHFRDTVAPGRAAEWSNIL